MDGEEITGSVLSRQKPCDGQRTSQKDRQHGNLGGSFPEGCSDCRSDKDRLISNLLGAVAVEALQDPLQETPKLDLARQKNAPMLSPLGTPSLMQTREFGDVVREKRTCVSRRRTLVVLRQASGKETRYWLKHKSEMKGLLKMLERVVNASAKLE